MLLVGWQKVPSGLPVGKPTVLAQRPCLRQGAGGLMRPEEQLCWVKLAESITFSLWLLLASMLMRGGPLVVSCRGANQPGPMLGVKGSSAIPGR